MISLSSAWEVLTSSLVAVTQLTLTYRLVVEAPLALLVTASIASHSRVSDRAILFWRHLPVGHHVSLELITCILDVSVCLATDML